VAPLLAVTVAVVLADSAVVTLALPAILRNLHTSVGQVAWVLISFNLVLGLVAVPVALLFTRARPRIFCALGIAVFAGASAWCASATSIDVLIAARCVQALGGAAAFGTVHDCMRRSARLWPQRLSGLRRRSCALFEAGDGVGDGGGHAADGFSAIFGGRS
jgi:MFS family permease